MTVFHSDRARRRHRRGAARNPIEVVVIGELEFLAWRQLIIQLVENPLGLRARGEFGCSPGLRLPVLLELERSEEPELVLLDGSAELPRRIAEPRAVVRQPIVDRIRGVAGREALVL